MSFTTIFPVSPPSGHPDKLRSGVPMGDFMPTGFLLDDYPERHPHPAKAPPSDG